MTKNYEELAREAEKQGWTEHAKLHRLCGQNRTVQAFIDWLYDEKGYTIRVWCEKRYYDEANPNLGYEPADHYLIPERREQLMAAFFGIDLKQLSIEKDAMYAAMIDSETGV